MNNGYRDTQENSFQNKMKVALDFYVQGWCDDTLMLSPSEYYVSAGMRTMVPNKFTNDDHHPSLCEEVLDSIRRITLKKPTRGRTRLLGKRKD